MKFLNNISWGLRWGITMAIGFSLIALIGSIAGPSEVDSTAHPGLASLITFYVATGIAGGLLIGLLRPVLRYRIGSTIVAMLVIGLVLALMEYSYVAVDGWKPFDTIFVVVASLVGGPIGAFLLKKIKSRNQTPSSNGDAVS